MLEISLCNSDEIVYKVLAMKYVGSLHTHVKPSKKQCGISILVPPTADVLKNSFGGA